MESRGLGDTIAKITHTLGIDRVADAVAKLAGAEGCGCKERQEYLNQLFPYQEYRRTFQVTKPFHYEGVNYTPGMEVVVTKSDPLFHSVIFWVQEGFLDEI